MLSAEEGCGCAHCLVGRPIEKVNSRYGLVELCLECVLLWFPGRSVAWWEERHAPYRDHLSDAVKRSEERELERAIAEART